MNDIKRIVNFSGGVGSWAAAKRVVERHGASNVTLLFADTLMEDDDLYRFLDEAAEDIGAELVRIADGRTPWDVFFDERMMGSNRVDLCSRILKRELLDKWREENCDPRKTVCYVGIDITEAHRIKRLKQRMGESGWEFRAPLCEKPYRSKAAIMLELEQTGIEIPRLYQLGFPHNNCGGFCVKAGQSHFLHLLKKLPETYKRHEEKEQEFREMAGKDVSILRNRREGESNVMTLRDFRKRHEASGFTQMDFESFEWGGCGCAVE